MKKTYEKPQMVIVQFTDDVLAKSSNPYRDCAYYEGQEDVHAGTMSAEEVVYYQFFIGCLK